MNLAQLIARHAAGRPHKPALEFAGHAVSYAELWRQIQTAAGLLSHAGIRPGDRVGLCLADHPAHVVMHYAVAQLAAVLVPVDHRLSNAEKKTLAAAFDIRLLVVDDSAPELEGIRLLRVPATICGDGDAGIPEAGEDDADWLISLSSGTTGRPKGALVTHRQMYERFVTQWVSLGFDGNDRFALVTPLCFGAGRSFAMSFLAAGATLILLPPPMPPDKLVAAINDSRATATFLVPTLLRRLLALPGDSGYPLFPRLRRLLISGEAFYADEVGDFQTRLSSNLIGYYASSEGGGVSVLQPEDFGALGATVGQAAFGVELQVVNADARPVAAGETGQLRYRGPGVTSRTIDENGRVSPGDPAGWFYPGDLASLDDRGYVTLRGREKDVVVRGGVNVYPAEIEAALLAHPDVADAAVIGARSATHGEEVVAYVVARGETTEAALKNHCAKELAPYKVPSRLVFLENMPKSRAGKTDKKALAALAGKL